MHHSNNRGRGSASSSGCERPAVYGCGRYGGHTRSSGSLRPYERVSTIQVSDDWPRQE